MDYSQIVWGQLDGKPVLIGENYSGLTFLPTTTVPRQNQILKYLCSTTADGKTCSELGVAEPLNLTNCRSATFGEGPVSCAIPEEYNAFVRQGTAKVEIKQKQQSKNAVLVFFYLIVFLFLSLLLLYFYMKSLYYE